VKSDRNEVSSFHDSAFFDIDMDYRRQLLKVKYKERAHSPSLLPTSSFLPIITQLCCYSTPSRSYRTLWSTDDLAGLITYGRGCRHQLDVAPFSLWDAESQDYTHPTGDQITWIWRNYLPSRVEWWRGYGICTIFTDTPSLLEHAGLVTLTVACVPVIFVPREAEGTF
jgi:hypothetical protein